MNNYYDILFLERPHSKVRSPMSRDKRAAQFAPFAALTGHEEAVDETARITQNKIILSDDAMKTLNNKLTFAIHNPEIDIQIRYFKKDKIKSGGEYIDVIGKIKKYDEYNKAIILNDGFTISIKDICEIKLIFF